MSAPFRLLTCLWLAALALALWVPAAEARDDSYGAAPLRIAQPGAPNAHVAIGWTHERWSPDSVKDAERAATEEALLAAAAPVQNTNIMGWGLPSPMPAPGSLDLAALDRRVEMMIRTARWPVITLCCAPDWMKGGEPGRTDWSRLETAPLPEHFADFARLSAAIAQRYPQVKHFMVWNELKGFWNVSANRWNAELYTDFYNQVFAAVKAVRPDAEIGGPYVVLSSYTQGSAGAKRYASPVAGTWGTVDRRALEVIDYWLAHKTGADFIAVDAGVMPREGDLDVAPEIGLQKFRDAQAWIRQRTKLPLWWAEYYPSPPSLAGNAAMDQLLRSVDVAETGGVSVLLFWNPACRAEMPYGGEMCLWFDAPGQGVRSSPWFERLTHQPTTTKRSNAK